MTMILPETKRCALCGCSAEYQVLVSSNTFGPPDLDTRPPEMLRSTLPQWVQRCPKCGFCAEDVSESRRGAEAAMQKPDYRRQLNHPDYPELANSFLCKGIIDRESGDHAAAAWAMVHAAWACDDMGLYARAAECRRSAVAEISIAEQAGQCMTKPNEGTIALLVDLLRRSGQAVEARRVIRERMIEVKDPSIAAMLALQQRLLDRGDTAAHGMDEDPQLKSAELQSAQDRMITLPPSVQRAASKIVRGEEPDWDSLTDAESAPYVELLRSMARGHRRSRDSVTRERTHGTAGETQRAWAAGHQMTADVIEVRLNGPGPLHQCAVSILSPKHPHRDRVEALLTAARKAMTGKPLRHGDLTMEVEYGGLGSQAHPSNLVFALPDIFKGVIYEDVLQIREIHCHEMSSNAPICIVRFISLAK